MPSLPYPLKIKPIDWIDGKVRWLDTRLLPHREVYRESDDYERVAKAIEDMEIRGAPAIGVAAALALAAEANRYRGSSIPELRERLLRALDRLSKTRPTAFNLFWALNTIRTTCLEKSFDRVDDLKECVVRTALSIMENDIRSNMEIGKHGSRLIEDGDTILTHCNAGALATAGFGTALGVIRAAWYEGKKIKVIATETRPLLQGARLTVWELRKEGIPVTLITDNMVGYVMSKGLVSKVIVGADRILRDGHVINKIGTYMIALCARRHNIPFYVAAPTSTIDIETPLENVVIEHRDPNEVRYVMNSLITDPNVDVLNPAFDVTPPDLVTAIVTEKGVLYPPYSESISKILKY